MGEPLRYISGYSETPYVYPPMIGPELRLCEWCRTPKPVEHFDPRPDTARQPLRSRICLRCRESRRFKGHELEDVDDAG